MWVVKKSTPEQLFSHQVDGKNYLNFYPAVTDSRRKTGNLYWLPLLKKLPLSMVEGFQEVKNILAGKGLTVHPLLIQI